MKVNALDIAFRVTRKAGNATIQVMVKNEEVACVMLETAADALGDKFVAARLWHNQEGYWAAEPQTVRLVNLENVVTEADDAE